MLLPTTFASENAVQPRPRDYLKPVQTKPRIRFYTSTSHLGRRVESLDHVSLGCFFRHIAAKDPFCQWQTTEVGFNLTKGDTMSDKREEVERAAALSFESILAAINKSSERAEALAKENRERAEALSLAQDERMYSHVATARDEILRHVSHDIDAVASQLRGETVDAVANLRAEAEASQALAHREAEAATASAARAIATVDDLRQEISEKQGGLVDVSGRVHVEALREEFRAALVSRDEQLQSLRSAVENQPTPSPPLWLRVLLSLTILRL